MKNLLKLFYFFPLVLLSTSCDHGFEEMNVNPNASVTVVPGYLFTRAQLAAVSNNFTGGAYHTIAGAMQHFSTYKEVPAAGDKYFNYTQSTGNWGMYGGTDLATQGAVIDIEQVIDAVSKVPADINKLSTARIWRVYMYHRLTDLYGDIPYTEAGKGLKEKNYTPVYDEQPAIYADMFKELEQAIAAFDPAQPTFGTSDLMYNGNIDKWKKFGYSLMLRLGMRLTEVDAALAKTWVQKAITGGVIQDDADIASIAYVDGSITASRNFIASGLMSADYITPGGDNVEGGKLAKTLIDHLKATQDPRLNVISIVWIPSADGKTFTADTTTSLQKGMPNAAFNSLPADFNSYSEPNPNTVLKYSAPLLVFTNAEVHLLLAEAAVRGWYSTHSAEESYQNAVRAGMKQWALFGNGGVISENKINAYLKVNPYKAKGTVSDQLEQIGTQKWVALFLEDEYEIFSNWRRTGFPKLTPTNYPGNLTGGKIPTRFQIPDSEGTYNEANFIAARTRQGGTNNLSSLVWWDK